MAVTIKTPAEIEKMRVSGRLAAEVLEMITPHVVAGISTGSTVKVIPSARIRPSPALP